MGRLTDDEYNKRVARPKAAFEVFLDMDGVLSDFDSHAQTQGKYDEHGKPKWDQLDANWWATMPAYDGMKQFYNDMKKIGNVRILTAPTLSSGCYRGKAEWVETQFGKWGLNDLIICRAMDKHLLARPHHILIDDRQKNVDEWNAAGGIGILHTGDYADTMARVQKAVADYQAKKTPANTDKPPHKVVKPNK
ncbi:MAG TPA: hypothetical protein VHP34_06700 [Alphaproteobacteria bacterium]|jgi:5'(3')-deoxyribonucleotidase|nr:hypothetical protein [Alphaproteobacteria bacterium]